MSVSKGQVEEDLDGSDGHAIQVILNKFLVDICELLLVYYI